MPGETFTVYVDGYNAIHAWKPFAESLDELDTARARIMESLVEYQSRTKNEVILVFDAHKVKGQPQRIETYQGITVVYTKPYETADLYIERALRLQPPEYRVMVVSNDSMIQQIILGRGGMRVTVQEFFTQLEDDKRLMRGNGARKKRSQTALVSLRDLLSEKEWPGD